MLTLTLDTLFTLVLGVAVGAGGAQMWGHATENRRARQARGRRQKLFYALRDLMPRLFAEMAADRASEAGKRLREFVILPTRSVAFIAGEPVLTYYENEHTDLRANARVLADAGFLSDMAISSLPRYRMLPEFVAFLRTSKS